MVWSGVWEHLSSWLSPNLTCITSVIRSELNEKYYFASDICTESRSVNRLCFSFTLPSSRFLFFSALPSFPPFVIPFFLLFFVPVNQSIPFLRPISPLFNLSQPPPCFPLTLRPPQAVVDSSETSVVLQHLSSLTEYQLAVFAVYANEASEALRGSETTCKFIPEHTRAHTRK